MTRFLVAGLINIETTLQIEGFPLQYNPVNFPFFGVNSSVSGVGYNLAKALTILGNEIQFLSIVGDDTAGRLVRTSLKHDHIPAGGVLTTMQLTSQSVILYDREGRRQIHTDLKDIQDRTYPPDAFLSALEASDVALICNINFARPFLQQAVAAGKPVATDVHTISSLDDAYNRDYMAAAKVLFMSDERLPAPPEDFARQVIERYNTEVVVIGMGSRGAVLAVRDAGTAERIPTVHTRKVVNSIGAGDALFSAFCHSYFTDHEPQVAIRKAMVFSSYKIGARSAADGFLDAASLEALYHQIYEG
jgi:sugar/nucleoside kinase (ribokinase family)